MSFETRFEANKLESELHREFSSFSLQAEYAAKYTGVEVPRKYSDGVYRTVKDGITEWFDGEIFEVVKQRYSLK